MEKYIDLHSLYGGLLLFLSQITGAFDWLFTAGAGALPLSGLPTNPREWAELGAWFVLFLLMRWRDQRKVRRKVAAKSKRKAAPVAV